ncbi:hypothetical protein [Microbacterium hominis]|uniref:Uncharacterized protein n=1 Tax=Microbacterium hominis TaxID=162426 RepID=A0A0B4CPV6_9MICO|nr:hypothetical protein [Microbacterium hominis]KIC56436.1 hypothetical protein RM52_12900 [Microbacterium hominis]
MVGAIVGVGLLGVALWWLIGGASFFQPRTVADLLSSTPSIQPIDDSAQLCRDIGCVEGWRTNLGTYLRFSSTGQAEYWATVLGDQGRRSDAIVWDMNGVPLSFDQKRQAIDILFATRDWS